MMKKENEIKDIGYFHELKENHKFKYWFGYFFLDYPYVDKYSNAEYY